MNLEELAVDLELKTRA